MSTNTGHSQIATGLEMIGVALKMNYVKAVDISKMSSPLLRVYFDSKLGSPVEKSVEELYAASLYEDIKQKLPDWKIARKTAKVLGSTLAKIGCKALDAAKLHYKFLRGEITGEQYAYEGTKRTLCTIASTIDKGWVFAGKHIRNAGQTLLMMCEVPEGAAREIANTGYMILCWLKPYIVNTIKSEKVVNAVATVVKTGAQLIGAGVTKVAQGIDKVIDTISPVVEKIAEVAKTTVKKVVAASAKVASTVTEGVKEAVTYVKNKVKSWFSW